MKKYSIRNFKIKTQLFISLGLMFLFVIILGVVSYRQSTEIHRQTEMMYNHPLQVRRAISSINSDILNIQLNFREMIFLKGDEDRQNRAAKIALAAADAQKQFNILYVQFLGSINDVDEARDAFIIWNNAREENQKLLMNGKIDIVIDNISETGRVGLLREKMMKEIRDIDNFAINKANSLYLNSQRLSDELNKELIAIVACILLAILFVSFFLYDSIRKPIKELLSTTRKFADGDMNARSYIDVKNEYGELSQSFNSLFKSVQLTDDLDKKVAAFSELMFLKEDPYSFFSSILPVLATNTNSQIVAVYLLSDDKKRYSHYQSFGAERNIPQTFEAGNFEGEFGIVLSTGKMHIINQIPIDTRFAFQTVSGTMIPREIITLPIISGNEIIAVISFASIRSYKTDNTEFINRVVDSLNARIDGVLSYKKLQDFSQKLEVQNTELDVQKRELEAQSVELVEQNRELEIQKNQLNEANRLKTHFLSNMSHELRTPLNSVIALAGVLSRRLKSKIGNEESSYLEVIERNGKHLLSLINDILDISRIESGHEDIEISKFRVTDLVNEIASMIEPQAVQKGIQLIVNKYNESLLIASDIDKCRHILQNLVGNAVKFTPKGKVEIEVKIAGNQIFIAVIDTGIGIPEKHIAHIFNEFRQADSSTSRKYGGTGLGLAIALKYANLLGGTIDVKSVENQGSIFTLRLPTEYNGENRNIEPSASSFRLNLPDLNEPKKNTETKTILIVEDSEPAVIQMKDFLEENGYKTIAVSDGAVALDVISDTMPDAIILDLMMPGVDGFEVLESIRNADQTALIPVLILTAKHLTKEDLKNLKRNNIHQLIQKGDVNRNEFLNAVSNLTQPIKKNENVVAVKHKNNKINGKPTILIVEDNPDNMISIKAIIDRKFDVIEAIDGNEAVEMTKKHAPHLVLMDIALPEMDGIQAFREIRKSADLAHIPVIALTASAMTTDRETILAHGFDAYIPKPIQEEEFFSTIDSVLYGK